MVNRFLIGPISHLRLFLFYASLSPGKCFLHVMIRMRLASHSPSWWISSAGKRGFPLGSISIGNMSQGFRSSKRSIDALSPFPQTLFAIFNLPTSSAAFGRFRLEQVCGTSLPFLCFFLCFDDIALMIHCYAHAPFRNVTSLFAAFISTFPVGKWKKCGFVFFALNLLSNQTFWPLTNLSRRAFLTNKSVVLSLHVSPRACAWALPPGHAMNVRE
jgi:hypothetical protein